MGVFVPLLIILIVVAALLREDSVLAVFYLLAGVYLVGWLWSRNAFRNVTFRRVLLPHAFYDQLVPVRIEIQNRGWLPLVWLKIHESLPPELISPNFVQGVITLGPGGKTALEYSLRGRKRGYYRLGPLFLDSGDMLGLTQGTSAKVEQEDYLVVYPRIVPLAIPSLPSNSPFGTLPERRPIFEDPARARGKRDYVAGDSLRRVDWKASAVTGRLQVKCYEPSIALGTSLVLDLNRADYPEIYWPNLTELAIVVTASLANWVVQHKGTVGFCTNGLDPLADESATPAPLPPRRGSAALMQVLEVLARIQSGETFSCIQLLRQAASGLPWGTTLVLVTSSFGEDLLDELFQAQRRGLNVMIAAIGPFSAQREVHRRAEHFGIPVHTFERESDLEVWRGTR